MTDILTPGILLPPRHDLPALLRAVGRLAGTRALDTSPTERDDPATPVHLLDAAPAPVTSDPMDVHGFVDGIQSAVILTYRSRRPVYLVHTAAGCVTEASEPLSAREDVTLIASATDADWVSSLGTDIRAELLAAELPPDVERDASRLLGNLRDTAERNLVRDLLEFDASPGRPIVVDGSLLGRPHADGLVGVVKTTRTRYLPDESSLYSLSTGWRSPLFRIPGAGNQPDRYSCYLRLHDSSMAPWSFGLVRLETFSLGQLEPLAARVLLCRQPLGAPDSRADRHLAPVRSCEEFLRSRRPALFDARSR